jgi:hypothetical protein
MADANREYVHFRWGKFWNTQSRVYVHFRWGKFGNKIMEATTMFYESCAVSAALCRFWAWAFLKLQLQLVWVGLARLIHEPKDIRGVLVVILLQAA